MLIILCDMLLCFHDLIVSSKFRERDVEETSEVLAVADVKLTNRRVLLAVIWRSLVAMCIVIPVKYEKYMMSLYAT